MRFAARRNHKLHATEGSKKIMDCSSKTIFKRHILRNIFHFPCHMAAGSPARRNFEFYAAESGKSLTNRGSQIFLRLNGGGAAHYKFRKRFPRFRFHGAAVECRTELQPAFDRFIDIANRKGCHGLRVAQFR